MFELQLFFYHSLGTFHSFVGSTAVNLFLLSFYYFIRQSTLFDHSWDLVSRPKTENIHKSKFQRGIPFGEVLTINPKNWYCVKMYNIFFISVDHWNIVSSKIQDVLKSNFRLKYFLSWWSWGLVPWRWTE